MMKSLGINPYFITVNLFILTSRASLGLIHCDFRDSEVECVRALFGQLKSLKILHSLHRNVQGRVGGKNRQKKEAANGNMFFSILIYTFNKKLKV